MTKIEEMINQAIIEDYNAGMKLEDIAHKQGVSVSVVYKITRYLRGTNKRCINCGKEFSPSNARKYCSSQCSCEYKKMMALGIEPKPKVKKSLGEWQKEAAEHGMSYGKYILWLEGNNAKGK